MALEETKQSLFQRQRNILHLISQYLADFGLRQTQATLSIEANLSDEFQICDNIDLDTIYLDYCSYFQLKFGKRPKVLKKIEKLSEQGRQMKQQKPIKTKLNGRKKQENQQLSTDLNTGNSSQIMLLSETVMVSSLANSTSVNDNKSIASVLVMDRVSEEIASLPTELRELADIVTRDIVKKSPNIKWSDIQGNDNAKLALFESVILPFKHPHLFYDTIKPWKGILLHGPTGSGKTMLAKALCSETFGNVTFFNITSSTVISKWRGESEKFLKILFMLAKLYAPSVIFIDEFECLATKRDTSSEHEATKRFKNEFLIQIDELDAEENGHVVLLANSNLPWEIDCAFLRRFELKINVDLPNEQNRIDLITHIHPIASNWKREELSELAKLTDGNSAADIKIAYKEAFMKKIRSALDLQQKVVTPVQFDDMKTAMQQLQPTMQLIAEKHRNWSQKFGYKIC